MAGILGHLGGGGAGKLVALALDEIVEGESRVEARQTEKAASAPKASIFPIYAAFLSAPRQGMLFEIAPDSDFADLVRCACQLASFEPELLELIDGDLDAHALAKKERRLEHRRWMAGQTATLIDVPAGGAAPTKLEVGRPRIAPLCVLTFMLLRGWLGGCKDERFQAAARESITLRGARE